MRMDAETNAERPQRGNKRKPAADATAGPKEKSHKKPWGTDGPPPPEWIAMAKEKKMARLAERERRRTELGLPDPKLEPPDRFNCNFIKRPILRTLDGEGEKLEEGSVPITVMTYNVLAQALIYRRIFPASGNALKWKNRSRMLTNEFTHYQPTIACMQEVDLEQYEPYFLPLFQSLGYEHTTLVGEKKRHCILIAWKSDKFELARRLDIHYDLLNAGTVGPSMYTGNVALCLGLRDKTVPGKGLWISTTHLYWHPYGSYERQRQAGILVSQTVAFASSERRWPIIICGGNPLVRPYVADEDFNSVPWGMTYNALTQRPIVLSPRQKQELEGSVSYDFRNVKEEGEDEEIAIDSEFETLTPFDPTKDSSNSTTSWTPKDLQQPLLDQERTLSITPASIENNSLVLQHHATNPPLESLYSRGLKTVQPDGTIGAFGEPAFTNWSHGYKETLDYIFALKGDERVRLLGLLRMPTLQEMGAGEPQEGRFPSDHVCEMAKIALS